MTARANHANARFGLAFGSAVEIVSNSTWRQDIVCRRVPWTYDAPESRVRSTSQSPVKQGGQAAWGDSHGGSTGRACGNIQSRSRAHKNFLGRTARQIGVAAVAAGCPLKQAPATPSESSRSLRGGDEPSELAFAAFDADCVRRQPLRPRLPRGADARRSDQEKPSRSRHTARAAPTVGGADRVGLNAHARG
jgi:hypothetical protein